MRKKRQVVQLTGRAGEHGARPTSLPQPWARLASRARSRLLAKCSVATPMAPFAQRSPSSRR